MENKPKYLVVNGVRIDWNTPLSWATPFNWAIPPVANQEEDSEGIRSRYEANQEEDSEGIRSRYE